MYMLVQKALETNGNVELCEAVMSASNAYRQKQDYLAQFVADSLEKSIDGFITRKELSAEFKNWCISTGNTTHKAMKELEEFMDKQFQKNIKKGGWDGCKLRDIEDANEPPQQIPDF
jgi:phage/plasmid-associated DNA primase